MTPEDRQHARAGFMWGCGLAAASLLMGAAWQLGAALAAALAARLGL